MKRALDFVFLVSLFIGAWLVVEHGCYTDIVWSTTPPWSWICKLVESQ